jgi:uncharacterized membrane protein YtjA (UPF0391 family)
MLRYAIIFLVIALICALFGFTGMAADFAWIGKLLALVFVILFVISVIMGRRSPV